MLNNNIKYFELIPVNSNRVSIEKIKEYNNEYVYDCEVKDKSHTFTANNILVHNSLYVKMDAIIKYLFGDRKPDWNNKEDFEKIKGYVDGKFQDDVNKYCADFLCEKFHTDQRRIEFKREKISEQGEYLAKKCYIVHVRDSEGHECDKFSYTGFVIKKNELPSAIKKLLGDCVEKLIKEDWNNERFQLEVRRIWEEYNNLPIEKISYIKNLNTPKNNLGFLTMEKGSGVHVKSATYYNQIIEKMNLLSKYELIKTSDRFHFLYIKTNNKYGIESIGYKDRWPKEFNNLFEVDREKMFEKTCMSPLKQIIINHNFSNFDPQCQLVYGECKKSIFEL